jgi:hypothetical protein
MKEFDPHLVLLQCCPNPFSEDFRKDFEGKVCYRMIMANAHCSTGRGFYFQPVVLEFSFKDYFPDHSSKTTFILTRWKEGENKQVPQLDGSSSAYPVLAFYICVNRDLFQPLGTQNKNEWLASTAAPRTEGIAHELLYADQYAKYFDPFTGQTLRSIEIPTVDQEEELLCPTYQIQASINRLKDNSRIFQSEQDFLNQQATESVQHYYGYWLETYGVRRDICHRRTCAFLKMRPHHDLLEATLQSCMNKHSVTELDALKFKRHVHDDIPFVQEFFVEVSKNGCNYSKIEVINHTVLILNKKNGN